MLTRLVCYVLLAVTALARLRHTRYAGVALIFALSAPLLIAITGLSVDIGYWYQNQTSLQSAADSAALAAAQGDANFSVTSNTTATALFALPAANNASGNKFNLTSSSTTCTPTSSAGCLTLSCTPAAGSSCGTSSTNSTDTWTATATIPRGSFFSRTGGIGFSGLVPGNQSATATAAVKYSSKTTAGTSCLVANPTNGTTAAIEVTDTGGGGGKGGIYGSNCSFTANCPAGTATAYGGSGYIQASGLVIAGTGCTESEGSSTICATSECGNSTSSDNYGIVHVSSAMPNPFVNLTMPTTWETVPVDTTSGHIPRCSVQPSSDGNYYYIYAPSSSSVSCVADSTALSVIPSSFSGTVVFGNSCVTGYPSIPSASQNCSSTGSAESFFFPNGFSTNKVSVDFGPGIYYFASSTGLNIGGGGSITTVGTNPANLSTPANDQSGNLGSTFVFEGTAGYSLGGTSSALNLTAPTSNCVTTSAYPIAAATTASPYDGTYGEGICGILIYQAQNDTAADTISGNSSSTATGIIYSPSATVGYVGGGSGGGLSAGTVTTTVNGVTTTSAGTLAILANSVIANGTGKLSLNLNTTDTAGILLSNAEATTTITLLTLLTG